MTAPTPTNDGDKKFFNVHGECATFGLGCSWIPAAHFGVAKGVIRLRCGFIGGTLPAPTYFEIGDHIEAIDLEFDTTLTSYEEILKLFWKDHHPWEYVEHHYKSIIFYHNPEQKRLSEKSMAEEQSKYDLGTYPFRTEILPVSKFYNAEPEHQHYLLTPHAFVLRDLNLRSPDELIYSHVACRLNGYIEGFGAAADFEAEMEDLCLSEELILYVQRLNKANASHNDPLCGYVKRGKLQ